MMVLLRYKIYFPVLALLIGLVIWELIVNSFDIKEYVLPAPSIVWFSIKDNFDILINDFTITGLEALLGFIIANILSLLIAYSFVHYPTLERTFYPFIVSLKTTPIIAIAPLLIIWFGYGLQSKVIMAAVISFFPLVVNATQGFRDVDEDALKLFRTLTKSKFQIFKHLRFPSALPTIFSALKISSTMAVVGAIVSEMMGAQDGLGETIILSSMNIDTPMLFAAIIFSCILGMLFFYAIVLFEKLINVKKYENDT